LFSGAQKRLTIVLGERNQGPVQFNTGGYIRWLAAERDHLFAKRIVYAQRLKTREVFPASVEKLCSDREIAIFGKLRSSPLTLEASVTKTGEHLVYYTRKFGYFLAFLDFIPEIVKISTGNNVPPSELKSLGFRSRDLSIAAVACLSSSTFFWFWNVLSDCRNLNRRDLLALPVNVEDLPPGTKQQLVAVGQRYLKELRRTSKTMTKSGLHIQTFDYAACKPIIDEIDAIIANHFGFTDEERDFIANYDIKYRLGADTNEDEE
jgi:hypothetical protein